MSNRRIEQLNKDMILLLKLKIKHLENHTSSHNGNSLVLLSDTLKNAYTLYDLMLLLDLEDDESN